MRGTQALVALPITLACFALVLQVWCGYQQSCSQSAGAMPVAHRRVDLAATICQPHAKLRKSSARGSVHNVRSGAAVDPDNESLHHLQLSSRSPGAQPVALPGLADGLGMHRCLLRCSMTGNLVSMS